IEVTAVGQRTGRAPRRVSLPGYSFERQRHWIDPNPVGASVMREVSRAPPPSAPGEAHRRPSSEPTRAPISAVPMGSGAEILPAVCQAWTDLLGRPADALD